MKITSNDINLLLIQIEKVKRRRIVDYICYDDIRYIDNADNLQKLKVYNDHLIFGRRGSGKTTLMLSSIEANSNDVNIIKDCEILKEKDKYSIIINLMLDVIGEMKKDFINEDYKKNEEMYSEQYLSFKRFFYKIFKRQDKQIYDKYTENKSFLEMMNFISDSLGKLINYPNEIKYDIQLENANTSIEKKQVNKNKILKFEASFKSNFDNKYKQLSNSINIASSVCGNATYSNNLEITLQDKLNIKSTNIKVICKEDLLKDLKEAIIDLIREYYILRKKHVVLYLDDFYLIQLQKQPYIIQYLHQIFKNCPSSAFCFKACSIPNRLKMNETGNSDLSNKHDFSTINLDTDLSNLDMLKDFLVTIACTLEPKANITKQDIISLFNDEEVLLYSIIATGGVPRDFLIALYELIRLARLDNKTKILKEHIYSVIKNLRLDKENSIEDDSDINPEVIRKAIGMLKTDVVEGLNTNVILYPEGLSQKHEQLLKNLVNLRYLHIIKDRTTTDSKKKEWFVPYLVDMSFYVSEKTMKRNFNFKKFWVRDESSRLRELTSSPRWNFPDDILDDDKI